MDCGVRGTCAVEDCCQHEAAMRAELSAASSLADKRPRHEIALPNLFDAARACIQATCDLLVGPLDAILAGIEREDIRTPLLHACATSRTAAGPRMPSP
jgi:hypothetical protein